MSGAVLEARGVSVVMGGRRILADVDVALHPGEVLALVGPNGAGKSTLLKALSGDLRPSAGEVYLLKALSGDLRPSAGEVYLDGVRLRDHSVLALARRRAVLSQLTVLTFPFTGLEVAMMGRHPHLGPAGESSEDVAIASEALARTDGLPFAERRFPTLSGGEQARVNIARALAQATPILLLDEPTAHLDPKHQHAALELARELAAAGGTVLAVLHDLNLASTFADRVALLHDGRLVASGSPWDVLVPDRLSAVFGIPFTVLRHPATDAPLLLPLGTRAYVDRREPACT